MTPTGDDMGAATPATDFAAMLAACEDGYRMRGCEDGLATPTTDFDKELEEHDELMRSEEETLAGIPPYSDGLREDAQTFVPMAQTVPMRANELPTQDAALPFPHPATGSSQERSEGMAMAEAVGPPMISPGGDLRRTSLAVTVPEKRKRAKSAVKTAVPVTAKGGSAPVRRVTGKTTP